MNLYQPTITGSLSVSGSVNISGSITIAGGGTISGTASIATTALTASFVANAQTASYVLNAVSSSFALTASSADNLLVRNTLTAQTLVVQTITSSVDFVTGSTRFGSISADTHVFTGSLFVTGSALNVNNGGLFVSSSNNVGINTTNPTSPLTVKAGSRSDTLRLTISGSSSVSDAVGITFGSSTYDKAQIIAYNENTGNAAGYLTFWTGGTPATTDMTERIRITSAGNVGIGIKTPTEILEVSGSIRALQTTNDGICQLITDSSNSTTYRAALATFGNTAVGTLLGITRAANSFLYKNGASLIIGTGASDPLIFSTNSTEKMRTTSDGYLRLAGAGIQFNGDTAAANALDDYEEGTWTPTVGGNATYSTQLGEYTKIGNMVYVRGQLIISGIGTGGTTNFQGLPFNSTLENGFCINKLTNSSLNFYSIYLRTAGTSVYASYQDALDGTLVVNPAYLTTSTEIQFSGCYRTS
jgi:hypothetical protein